MKEPFIFEESVDYGLCNEELKDQAPNGSLIYKLHEMCNVLPFGYVAEQFLRETKQDIYRCIQESRA